MRWKTTLVLLAATVGLGAYVSLYEIQQPPRELRDRIARQILEVDTLAVTRVELAMPLSNVHMARESRGWYIDPEHFRADAAMVEALLTNFSPLISEHTLTGSPEQPLDAAAYGLAPPIGRVVLITGDGASTIHFGDETPVSQGRYVQVGGRPEIFVVPRHVFETANQSPEAFRDRTLMRFDRTVIDSLIVVWPASRYRLVREADRWRLTEPFKDLADRAEVQALLGQLGRVTIAQFLDGTPVSDQLAAYGLQVPTTHLTIREGGPTQMLTVAVGGEVPDTEPVERYIRRSDASWVGTILAGDLEVILRSPHGLRARSVMEFFTNEVTRLEVQHEEMQWTLAHIDGSWQAEGSTTALDDQLINEWLYRLADLRLSGFVDDDPQDLTPYGLEPPTGTIRLWTREVEEPQSLSLGGYVEGSASRFGMIGGRAAVVRLPGVAEELVTTTREDLQPAVADQESPPD